MANKPGTENKSLQSATGNGKEVKGFRYPYPAPYVLALMEDEFGALDKMSDSPTKHAYHFSLMVVALLELQREGKLKEVIGLTKGERRKAASDVLERKKIKSYELLGARGKAALEVFFNALKANPKGQ